MKKLFLLFIIYSAPLGCAVPQYIWTQHDMAAVEVNRPDLDQKILIASRTSEFKDAVVQKVLEGFRDREVFVRLIGIEGLAHEDAKDYSAVVLVNTAMAWTIDRKVEAFLEKYGHMDSIIVLTTSDGGDIRAEDEAWNVDAISSASTPEAVDGVSIRIARKLDELIAR